jgi:alpha-tubulin suppressor-like RCC1 family protein
MTGRALPLLVALAGGCLAAPPSGTDGSAPDAGTGDPIACDEPGDCPDTGRSNVCHCGACATTDVDCVPNGLRWVRADGTDGECVPAPIDLALGDQSSCLRWSDGRVSCWGDDCYGEIGDGGESDCTDGPQYSATPRLVLESTGGAPFGDVVALSAGHHHVCALRRDGSVWCWGDNDQGELGNDSLDARSTVPVQVVTDSGDALSGIVAIAAGSDHSCGLDSAGNVFCWGDNSYQQLGVTGISSRNVAARIASGTGFENLAAGGWHSCASRFDVDVEADRLYCWGRGTSGQLGSGATMDSDAPLLVFYESEPETGLAPTVFGLGEAFSCSATAEPAVYCWGSNTGHALGDELSPTTADGMNTATARQISVVVPVDHSRVAAGGAFACARTVDATVFCWGANNVGQLGLGYISEIPVGPTNLVLDSLDIEAGYDHACSLTSTGAILCWGANLAGQLGTGDTVQTPTPTEVMSLCQ